MSIPPRPSTRPDGVRDQLRHERAVALRLVGARRRAQERDGLAAPDPLRELPDERTLPLHLLVIAEHVLLDRDGRGVLAVVRGVELDARTERLDPLVPG